MTNQERDQAIARLSTRLDNFVPESSWASWLKLRTNRVALGGTVCCALIALCSWLQPQWSSSAKETRKQEIDAAVAQALKPLNTDLRTLSESVARLSATVDGLRVDVQLLLQAGLDGKKRLTQSEFDHALPLTSTQIGLALKSKTSIQAQTVEAISDKLLMSKETQDVYLWQASAQMVSYRFAMAQSLINETSGQQFDIRRDCLDTLAPGTANIDIMSTYPGAPAVRVDNGFIPEVSHRPWRANLAYGHCTLALDSPKFASSSSARYLEEVRSHHPGLFEVRIALNDARITYGGGKLIPFNTLAYERCLFSFAPPTVTPPAGGRSITRDLLTANIGQAEIKIVPAS